MNDIVNATPSISGLIRTFLARHIRGEFPDDVDLFATGRMNSLFALQLVLYVEKQFGIRVESDDLALQNFSSVEAISRFVDQKLGAR